MLTVRRAAFLVLCLLQAIVLWSFWQIQPADALLRFDIGTFCCPCFITDHFCDDQFSVLNRVSDGGHYLAMGTDWRRADVEGNGNQLAYYYNTLNVGWTQMSGQAKADQIWNPASSNFPGGIPRYFILNEISAGLWPNNPEYRAWVHDVVHSLKNDRGVDAILASPFERPGRNDSDWQAVSEDAFIAAETYLSGGEIRDAGFSVDWCRERYERSKWAYLNRGVPESKLMLIEHFGQTTEQSGWGRAGVSFEDWDTAIIVRSMAAQQVGFVGFL